MLLFQGSWEKKIIDRVHNVSKSHKKRPCDDVEGTPKTKRGQGKSAGVLTRYPPICTLKEGYDHVALSRDLNALQKEMEKERPRKEVVLTLMKQTFIARREYILSDDGDVSFAGIVEKYKGITLPICVSLCI